MCLKKVTLNSTDFKVEKLKTLLLEVPYLSDRQNTTHIADSYGIIRQQCTGSSTGRPQKLMSVQKGTDRQKHTRKNLHTPLESGNNKASEWASYSSYQSLILKKLLLEKVHFFSERKDMRKIWVVFYSRELLFKTFCNAVTEYTTIATAANASHCLSHKKGMSYRALLSHSSLFRMVLFIKAAPEKELFLKQGLSQWV